MGAWAEDHSRYAMASGAVFAVITGLSHVVDSTKAFFKHLAALALSRGGVGFLGRQDSRGARMVQRGRGKLQLDQPDAHVLERISALLAWGALHLPESCAGRR